ncbi:MAG: 4Fe-4S binding protein [archaeon]|jgi:pyruvate ferredoxin oxidoreductase delta subunit
MTEKQKHNLGGVLPGGTALVNKTGSWRSVKPVWDSKKCIHCMLCFNACPEHCILTKKDKTGIKRGETNMDYCKGCGICAEICPVKCIKMVKE